MPRGAYKRRQNIYVNGKKICANPHCWEEIPKSRVYCSPECSHVCKILEQKAKRKKLVSKYQKEYKTGIPKRRIHNITLQ